MSWDYLLNYLLGWLPTPVFLVGVAVGMIPTQVVYWWDSHRALRPPRMNQLNYKRWQRYMHRWAPVYSRAIAREVRTAWDGAMRLHGFDANEYVARCDRVPRDFPWEHWESSVVDDCWLRISVKRDSGTMCVTLLDSYHELGEVTCLSATDAFRLVHFLASTIPEEHA